MMAVPLSSRDTEMSILDIGGITEMSILDIGGGTEMSVLDIFTNEMFILDILVYMSILDILVYRYPGILCPAPHY